MNTTIFLTEDSLKIYTSYIANAKKLLKAGITPITIVRYPKKFHDWIENIQYLSPTGKYWNLDEDTFARRFREEYLNQLDAKKALAHLKYIGKGNDVALLCFESSKEHDYWCHRQTVAKWLEDELGIEVKEITSDTPTGNTPQVGK
jgi:hypothetical protein